MKILAFLRSLLPRLGKDQILEDLRITKTEIEKNLIPSYDAAVPHFKTNKIKSKDTQVLVDLFYRNYDLAKSNKQSSIVAEIASRLKSLVANLDMVNDAIEETMEQDIINEGLTARKALLVRAAEQISVMSSYMSDLLILIYYNEAYEYGAQKSNEAVAMPAKAINRVKSNIVQFARLLSVYGQDNKDFAATFVSLPDVVVNSKTVDSLVAVYQENKLDPFSSMMMQNFEGSPIYHLRLVVAEWQANRYKKNKDKKKMLELRLLYLKSLMDESPDPALEREIEYIQSRIEKIEYEMHKATE